jgi:hypothetical protein
MLNEKEKKLPGEGFFIDEKDDVNFHEQETELSTEESTIDLLKLLISIGYKFPYDINKNLYLHPDAGSISIDEDFK